MEWHVDVKGKCILANYCWYMNEGREFSYNSERNEIWVEPISLEDSRFKVLPINSDFVEAFSLMERSVSCAKEKLAWIHAIDNHGTKLFRVPFHTHILETRPIPGDFLLDTGKYSLESGYKAIEVTGVFPVDSDINLYTSLQGAVEDLMSQRRVLHNREDILWRDMKEV